MTHAAPGLCRTINRRAGLQKRCHSCDQLRLVRITGEEGVDDGAYELVELGLSVESLRPGELVSVRIYLGAILGTGGPGGIANRRIAVIPPLQFPARFTLQGAGRIAFCQQLDKVIDAVVRGKSFQRELRCRVLIRLRKEPAKCITEVIHAGST